MELLPLPADLVADLHANVHCLELPYKVNASSCTVMQLRIDAKC